MEPVIRSATPSDVPVILSLIKELAAFEREPDAVVATLEDLHEALFGADAVAGCSLAEVDGAVVGFALWYRTFSTWQGKPGLWLEDLFVLPSARGTGLGRALLVSLAQLAVSRGWTRFEWWVLDWNVEAQGFYRSLGARPEDEWTVWRVDGKALGELGS
jgi:GNAT superfamily N-acetyltransferase